MRRLLFSLVAVCLTGVCLAGLSGCYQMSGVCDCELDRDPCASRAPWALGCCAKGGCCADTHVAPVLGGGSVTTNPNAPKTPSSPSSELPRLDPPRLEEDN